MTQARMLARVHPGQCNICRCMCGDPVGPVGRTKRQVRTSERDETQREADLVMRERVGE